MPPRRSCFRHRPGGDNRRDAGFQCHHGVPASGPSSGSPSGRPGFQCHHGVPASLPLLPDEGLPPPSFNATTALLLQGDPEEGEGQDPRFNATTAFLLRLSFHINPHVNQQVSMPPRRSCFARLRFCFWSRRASFNATTAFLLPGGFLRRYVDVGGGFNATTAFLLLRSLGRGLWVRGRFQCHHGVPASSGSCTTIWAAMGFNATTAFLLQILCDAHKPLKNAFNATTAFLLRNQPPARRRGTATFNATTAFLLHVGTLPSVPLDKSSFNATTAFLLLVGWTQSRDLPDGVSMPPRRSCFLLAAQWAAFGDLFVSMPPRRSCFLPWRQILRAWLRRFNATTAFLLPPGGQDESLNPSGVSMPPRRSCFFFQIGPAVAGPLCFNATTAFLLQGRSRRPQVWYLVSMPPRRSCFPGWPGPSPPRGPGFQCHHGVPASLPGIAASFSEAAGFNATTAFLLHGLAAQVAEHEIPFQCHHGVPASETKKASARSAGGFNATTAFLLPRRSRTSFGRSRSVSMPPRRSCFGPGVSLLPGAAQFQCHHGVPASGSPRAGPGPTREFQCHHGVPASGMDGQTIIQLISGFNATTAFLLRCWPPG